jgi:hypothetical protein
MGEMIARLVRNINPYPLGAGVTAPSPGVRLVLNPSASSGPEAGGKGGKREPDVATPPNRWLWTGYSTKVCRRRHGEPAYAGYRPKGTGRPKGERFQVLRAKRRKTALVVNPA